MGGSGDGGVNANITQRAEPWGLHFFTSFQVIRRHTGVITLGTASLSEVEFTAFEQVCSSLTELPN